MARSNNEGKACDAVVRLLEQRTGQKRTNVRRPEMDHIGPPVEIRLNLGTQDYAIEHTHIEAFPGQIRTEAEFGRFINPVVEELSGTLPEPGAYHLYFPTDARIGVRADELERVQSDLKAWVREHSQRLQEENPHRPTRERNPRGFDGQYRAKPPGFPYEVTLRRESHWSLSPRHDGILLVARIAPEDVEAQRAARLARALERKCPKLWQCKQEGSCTILILEDDDICLSNYALIEDGLAGILAARQNLPDEIYLIETAVDPWTVRLMKREEDCSRAGDWIEFLAHDLTDMTAKAEKQEQCLERGTCLGTASGAVKRDVGGADQVATSEPVSTRNASTAPASASGSSSESTAKS